MGDSNTLYMYCHGTENPWYLLESLCLITIGRGECPGPIALCEESPYDLMAILGSLSVILQPSNFYKVEFTSTSSAGKTARKIKKILRSFGFNWELVLAHPVYQRPSSYSVC